MKSDVGTGVDEAVSLPPWGGSGLKFVSLTYVLTDGFGLPPWGGSGLKYRNQEPHRDQEPSPSLGREWIEIAYAKKQRDAEMRLPPWGGSGLKYIKRKVIIIENLVSLLGEGVD